jgi:integrase
MKNRYRLITRGSRGGAFYCVDGSTGKRTSLGACSRDEAEQIILAKNQSLRQPALNLQIARAYLGGSDEGVATRTWQHVMDEIPKLKKGETRARWLTAMKDRAFDTIRHLCLLETKSDHILRALEEGTVSTNVFLRRIHNFALDMNWLPWPIVPKKCWPNVKYKQKRAITQAEHEAIIAREHNHERKMFYKLAWHLGASQSDIAFLEAENIDWNTRVLSFARKKTGSIAIMRFDDEVAAILSELPQAGPLFPYLRRVRSCDRATEFKQRCQGLEIKGVTLHSYRYSWAERAKRAGYPERFAQQALGHNSKAVHRAYAKNALVELPCLSEYEQKIVPFQRPITTGCGLMTANAE